MENTQNQPNLAPKMIFCDIDGIIKKRMKKYEKKQHNED
jgi:hypothetical protein